MSAFCICGRTEKLGRMHNCRHPDGPKWSVHEPKTVTHKSVTHTSVTHTVTHAPTVTTNQSPRPDTRSKAAERQARYRAKHGDTYKQRHRDFMRQKRATENTAIITA